MSARQAMAEQVVWRAIGEWPSGHRMISQVISGRLPSAQQTTCSAIFPIVGISGVVWFLSKQWTYGPTYCFGVPIPCICLLIVVRIGWNTSLTKKQKQIEFQEWLYKTFVFQSLTCNSGMHTRINFTCFQIFSTFCITPYSVGWSGL